MDSMARHKLMAWLSPGYPIGAFSYSHGLEFAVHDGVVTDAASLTDWLSDIVQFGSGRNDAILLAQAHRAADQDELQDIADLATALSASAERHLETTAQGTAGSEDGCTEHARSAGEQQCGAVAALVPVAATRGQGRNLVDAFHEVAASPPPSKGSSRRRATATAFATDPTWMPWVLWIGGFRKRPTSSEDSGRTP